MRSASLMVTHSLTHSPTHSLTHSLTRSLARSCYCHLPLLLPAPLALQGSTVNAGNQRAYANCMRSARTFHLRDTDMLTKKKGTFAAPETKYFAREIAALKAALELEPVPANRAETRLKIEEYEQRAKKAAAGQMGRHRQLR
jgi:hypothetical protein